MEENVYELLVLIAALKQRKKPNMFLWNLLVRGTKARDKAKFEVQTKKSRRIMAPFVGKYENGVVLMNEGHNVTEFAPGQIKPIIRAEANELLEKPFGGTIYDSEVTKDDLVDDQQAEELAILDEAIQRTEFWMLAQAMTKGRIPIVGKSIDTALVYGCDPSNFEVLSGTSLWTNEASDPLKYIEGKQNKILKDTGILIDSLVLTPSAATAFKNHPKIKDKLDLNQADILRIQPRNLGDGATFLGTITELNIDVYKFIDWVVNVETGVEEPILPEGGALFVKAKSVEVHYGAIAQIPWGEKKRQLFVGDRIPKYFVDNDSEMLRLASAPFPNPDDVDGFAFSVVA